MRGKFKKILIILIINTGILLALYAVLEISAFFILLHKYIDIFARDFNEHKYPLQMIFPRSFNPAGHSAEQYREPVTAENSKKPAILIFGCSFAHGQGLMREQTFDYKISKLKNISVYNRAECCMGTQTMLYHLLNDDLKSIVPKCGYIIYIYIPDHINRNLKFRCFPFSPKTGIRYKLKSNGGLKQEIISPPLSYSFLYRIFEERETPYAYKEKLFYKIIESSYNTAIKLYPSSKFIILNYSNEEKIPMQTELEKLGIQVISLSELTDENLEDIKYQISETDAHPNEKAWDLIAPEFIKKAEIK